MVDRRPKRTTSSRQATTATTSSRTNISSHMMEEGIPGTSSNSGPRVREECLTGMTMQIMEEQDKVAAISSSITAGVADEAVVIRAEGCSTRILCKLECRIRGEIGDTSSKIGLWTSSRTSNTVPVVRHRKITATAVTIPGLPAVAISNITTATISRESSCATVILTIHRPPNTISNRGNSTATSIRRSREMSRKAITKAMISIITAWRCRVIKKAITTQHIGLRCLTAGAIASRLQMSAMRVLEIIGMVQVVTPPFTRSSLSMGEAEDSRSTCSSRECRSIKPTVLPISSSATRLLLEVLVMSNHLRKAANTAREAATTLTTFEVVVWNSKQVQRR